MRFTFFNGVDTVGGVQVLLSTASGGLQFDLGVVRNPAIAPSRVLFNDFVHPRGTRALRDYLQAGMAPRIRGLYGPLAPGGGDPARTYAPIAGDLPLVDPTGELAVFVSHAHDDHLELLPFVSPTTSVHMASGTAGFHDALVAAGEVDAPGAPIDAVPDGESFVVGDIVCEPLPVDHDIPGCAGFVARTPSGTVAYTGDWRYHGNASKLIDAFVERCRAADIDVLITEGSTLVRDAGRPECSEQELVERFDDELAHRDGLVSVGVAPRNVERISAFAQVAAAHGRRLALRPSTARILWESYVRGIDPSARDHDIVVLYDEDAGDDAVPTAWETLRPSDVAADRRSFVCDIAPEAWYLWLDLGVGHADVHIHANGSPYGYNDPLWRALETWVGQLGIDLVVLDSHGHAFPRDLEWMAREIAPKVVVPVHTNEPSLFPEGAHELVLPGRGETIERSF
jgi:ribonuclease J